MIETVLQAPGRFELAFDNPPEEIRKLTARAFAALIVTPAPLARGDDYTYSDLLAMASYVGIVTARSDDRTKISGYGPAWLLNGPRVEADAVKTSRPFYDGTNTSWIRNDVLQLGTSQNNGITVGTISSSSSGAKKGALTKGQSRLDVLNWTCRRFGKEWRINPNGTLDAGSKATMYPTTTTPTAMVTRVNGGSEVDIKGLAALEVDDRVDWDDYTSEVVAHYQADDYDWGISYAVGDTVVTALWTGSYYKCKLAHTSSATNQPPNTTYWDAVNAYATSTLSPSVYVNPYSASAIIQRRVIDAKNVTDYGDAGDVADQQLARFDDINEELTISTDVYDISSSVKAGDGINVWDPENDLYNISNPVAYQGRLVYPRVVRVHAVRDACTAVKGYYLRSWNGTAQELHDLTPFVAFESSGVTLECGQPRRRRAVTPVSF